MPSREPTTHNGCIDVSVSPKSVLVHRPDNPLVRIERALRIRDGGSHRNPHLSISFENREITMDFYWFL
jgi:hypothetical protein